MASGGARRCFGVRLKGRTSGLLDPAAQVMVMLWSGIGGQGGTKLTSGKQFHGGRAHLRRLLEQISVLQGPRSSVEAPGSFTASR